MSLLKVLRLPLLPGITVAVEGAVSAGGPTAAVAPHAPVFGPQLKSKPGSKRTSSADDPEWVALTIEPIVSKIYPEQPLQLRAMAEDSTGGDPVEVNPEVIWTTSDAAIVSVTAEGLATASAVTGSVVITATQRTGPWVATRELEVQFRPTYGPAVLKSIDLSPATSDVWVTGRFQLKALGTYSDGSTQMLTTLVDWDLSRAEGLQFEPNTGIYDVTAAGSFTLAATIKGSSVRSNTVAVNAKEIPAPPSPRVYIESVKFAPDLLHGYEIEVGQTLTFVATATLSNRQTKQVTKDLTWSSMDKSVLTVVGPGIVKAVGPGEARFVVEGNRGQSITMPEYGWVSVLTPAFKVAPKAPTTGALTTASARIMVENIVALGQPGYMMFGRKNVPATPKATGQGPLDALLKMGALVVALWWSNDGLLRARQLWKVIHPKLLGLLKEAATPAVGLTVKELDPAYDALLGMDDYVKDERRRGIEANYVRKTTPFGVIEVLWADRLPLEATISDYDEARSLFPKLKGALSHLKSEVAKLPKVVQNLDALHAEIERRASTNAEQQAKTFQLQESILEILTTAFKDLEADVKSAQTHSNIALDKINLASDRKGIDEMKRQAAEANARVNLLVDAFQTATTTVFDPASGVVAVMDVAQDLFVNYVDTELADKIKRLEDSTNSYSIAVANDEYALCKTDLDNVNTKMAEVTKLLASNRAALEVHEFDVIEAYDADKGAKEFKLGDLKRVFELSLAATPLVAPFQKAATYARNRTSHLLYEFKDQNNDPLYKGSNRDVLELLMKDAKQMIDAAEPIRDEIEKIRRSLMQIRSVAYNAVFRSKFDRSQALKKAK